MGGGRTARGGCEVPGEAGDAGGGPGAEEGGGVAEEDAGGEHFGGGECVVGDVWGSWIWWGIYGS